MRVFSFKCLLVVCLWSPAFYLEAQDEPQTLRIKKESNLVKAVFDNTELRLIVVDRFGNPRENKIISYKLWIKGKGSPVALHGYSNSLTTDMLQVLKKQSRAVKIFFTDISVQEDDGHLSNLPDVIETWFPDCENCQKTRPKSRG